MALTKVKLNTMVTGNLPDANIPDNITITNAGTATALQNARTINGTSFDGTANITVTSAAGTLTGNTLASGVTASSLTSVGTLSSLNVSGNAVISGTLQSDDFTLDAGAGNPDLVIKTSASSSATAQMLFLTGNKDFTLINDTDNFRLYNSTPGVGVDVMKVIGSSSDILFGDVGNSRHLSLDYSNGDVVVNGNGLGVGAVPRQYYKLDVYKNGNSCILGLRSESHACTQYFQTGTTVTGQLEFSTSQGWLTTRTASPLKLGINNVEKLTIGADGNTTFAGVGNFTRDASGFNTYIFNDNGAGEGLHIKVKGNDSGQTGRYLIKAEGYGSSGAFTNNFLVDTDGNTTIGGDVTISKSSAKMTVFSSNTGDHEALVFDRNTASNGDSQEIRWKLQGNSYPGGYILHEYSDANNSEMAFGTRDNGTPATVMVMGAAGDIRAKKHSFISDAVSDRRGFLFKGDGGTSRGSASVQNSGMYGMVFGRAAYTASAGAEAIGKSHWGGISIIGFAGSGVQGIDIVAWGYGAGGATVLKGGNWVGSLARSYSTSNYHLMVDVGTDCTMWSILIGI